MEDGAPEFGKAKLLTRELPESMTADEFQVILGKEMTLAGCANSRKTPAFVKKKASGLSSKPAKKELKRVKAAGTRADDAGPATVALRPGQFPENQPEAQGKGLWCSCCGTEVGTAHSSVKKHVGREIHKKTRRVQPEIKQAG